MPTKEYYFNYYKNIIKNKEGNIISTEYVDSSTKIKYKCKNDHQVETLPRGLKQGRWCKICNQNRLLNKDGKAKMYNEVKDIIKSMRN